MKNNRKNYYRPMAHGPLSTLAAPCGTLYRALAVEPARPTASGPLGQSRSDPGLSWPSDPHRMVILVDRLGQNGPVPTENPNPSDTYSPVSVSVRSWRLEEAELLRPARCRRIADDGCNPRPASSPLCSPFNPFLSSSMSLPRPWRRLSAREDGAGRSPSSDGDGHGSGLATFPTASSSFSLSPLPIETRVLRHGTERMAARRLALCPQRGHSLSAVVEARFPDHCPCPSSRMPLQRCASRSSGTARPDGGAPCRRAQGFDPVSFSLPSVNSGLGFLCWWGCF
jgi:hypothetical protein